jgi:hypothetical protein
VIFPFSMNGRLVTKSREVNNILQAIHKIVLRYWAVEGKFRALLAYTHRDEPNLKRLVISLITIFRKLILNFDIYAISRLCIYILNSRKTQDMSNKKTSVFKFIKLLTLANYHGKMFRNLFYEMTVALRGDHSVHPPVQ